MLSESLAPKSPAPILKMTAKQTRKYTAWKTKAKCQEGEKNGPTIIFKLLKPENTDAVTMKKSANTEQKKKTAVRLQNFGQAMMLYGQFS